MLVAAFAVLMSGCGGGSDPEPIQAEPTSATSEATPEPTATGDLNTCAGQVQDEGRACYSRELAAIVNGAGDPLAAVEGITEAAYTDQSGFLLANCHGIMHTVAREYALRTGLKLEKLMDSLPRTNDPGCSAGYAHGLVTAVAPEIEQAGPKIALQLCAKSETRYQRYSCTHGFGHAFMRLNNEQIAPSLQMCDQLGEDAAADCSQGIYHDYWFAVNGLDSTAKPEDLVTDPRELCGAQPEQFVRVCWYRSFVETAQGKRMESGEELDEACSGLADLQREACITGASVVGPADPTAQLEVCSGLEAASDVVACIRGTKVQNLAAYPIERSIDLIKACNTTFSGKLAIECDRWLGKTLGVVTDGEFRTTGCPELPTSQARRACLEGVKSMDGPLITFS